MKSAGEGPIPTNLDSSYAGMSPQLLARTRQMWSARGLDLDRAWLDTTRQMRGFRSIDRWNDGIDSRPVDGIFMFDQAVVWVASLKASAACARQIEGTRLIPQQWEAIHALTFRLMEQLAAIRLLGLAELSSPSMQIARSVSEDVDMALAFLSRPKLARRFVECGTVDEANEFWRRHIAGGRAFRAVSEQLYRSGLEFDQDGAYSTWRKSVMAILGTAVHTSFRSTEAFGAQTAGAGLRGSQDCLCFVTLRLQEMCAYSQVLEQGFRQDLGSVAQARAPDAHAGLASWACEISEITVEQLRWSLANSATEDGAASHPVA